MASESGTLGRGLGCEGGAFMDEISDLIKEAPESSLTSFTCEHTADKTALGQQSSKQAVTRR